MYEYAGTHKRSSLRYSMQEIWVIIDTKYNEQMVELARYGY